MWNDVNGVFYSYATFRVYGKKLEPDVITKSLGIIPTESDVDAGFGIWLYSTKDYVDKLVPLENHIEHILERLYSCKNEIQNLQPQYTMDIFCLFASGTDAGGFNLSQSLLQRIAVLNLWLKTDEYFMCSGGRVPEVIDEINIVHTYKSCARNFGMDGTHEFSLDEINNIITSGGS